MLVAARPARRHRGAPVFTGFILWLVLALPAAAHSELVSSAPVAGSSVTAAPGFSVVLAFSEALKSGSKADVVGPTGGVAGTATIDPNDDTKLTWIPPATLPTGSYTIRWTSIATDGDVLRGTIPFSVVAAAASSSAPTTTPAASPPSGNASGAGIVAIIPVFVALLFVGLLALVLLRNRRAAARP
jgi:copper resistance protein C